MLAIALLRISPQVIADMIAHAREESPRECCGLLIGRGGDVDRCFRARNIAARPTRYLVDPEDHFAAIREARADRREVIGAYHSHPASAPVPSLTDIEEAYSGPGFCYVIVSLIDEDVRAYRFQDGRAVPVPLDLIT